jgi:lysylphosphatidylglycerol synthetase-like protein (DUF2156 family)
VNSSDLDPLLSALSVMLAAYGFMYAASRQSPVELDIPRFDLTSVNKKYLRRKLPGLKVARNFALVLALVAAVVIAVFASVTVNIVRDIHFSLPYSPVKAAIVLIMAFWVTILVLMFIRFVRLQIRFSTVKRHLEPDVSSQTSTGVSGGQTSPVGPLPISGTAGQAMSDKHLDS